MAKTLLRFNLNAFLKLYSLDPARQIAEIARRLQSDAGGYDYYRTFHSAVEAHLAEKSADEVAYILSSASRPDEISYNNAAFQAFVKRFGKNKSIESFEKIGKLKLAKGAVEVRSSPSFTFEKGGVLSVVHFWSSQQPPLDKSKANIACYILQKSFEKSAPNYKYCIFDTVNSRLYSGTNNTAALAVDTTASVFAHYAKLNQ